VISGPIKKIKVSLKKKIRHYKASNEFRKEFEAFKKHVSGPVLESNADLPNAAAVLLSYKRPKNLPWIAKSLLKNNFISRVIVSNNNPDMKMEDWFDFNDERLELMNQKVRRLPGYRFEIARHLKEEYIICIDDDLYLRPAQIIKLYSELLNNPAVPHGVWGQRFYNDGGELTWKDGIRNLDGEIDVMNRAYFLTRKHIDNFIKIINMLGFDSIEDLQFVDDMVLSFSGSGRPICHDVGPLLNCLSKDAEDIAVWKEHNFFPDRIRFYERLVEIKKTRTAEFQDTLKSTL
jgi:hypothetical protein